MLIAKLSKNSIQLGDSFSLDIALQSWHCIYFHEELLIQQKSSILNKLYNLRDFPRPDLRLNIGPFPIQKWAKTSQNGVCRSQFLSSTFWWNFHENPNKIAKLLIHENLHKNVNENMFSFTFLYKFSRILWREIKATNMLQLYTANLIY